MIVSSTRGKPAASMRRVFVLCTALALLCGPGAARAAGGASLGQLPQGWRDDSARDLPLSALKGHRVVLTMAYATCHRICPMTLRELEHLQEVADARAERVDFVIVGYDPVNDSPAVWHRYRASRGLTRPNWHFLSGSTATTRALARQLGFPFWTMDDGHVMHESRAILFDSEGEQRAVLGLPTSQWADAL